MLVTKGPHPPGPELLALWVSLVYVIGVPQPSLSLGQGVVIVANRVMNLHSLGALDGGCRVRQMNFHPCPELACSVLGRTNPFLRRFPWVRAWRWEQSSDPPSATREII